MRKTTFLKIAFISAVFLNPACIFASEDKAEEDLLTSSLAKEDIYYELGLFADAVTVIDGNYVREVRPRDMIYGALEGMVSSLDSHSCFLTPQEYKDLRMDTFGEFGGIVIRVTLKENTLTVVSPLEGTPAYKAGIISGDRILKVDNKSTEGFTLDDAVEALRGIPGTRVRLTIIRKDEDRLREFTIRRSIIKIKSIKEALILKDTIGYIKIAEFQKRTGRDLSRALKKLIRKGMKSLILDLRNNPGGLLQSAIAVSELFLEKPGIIVSIKGKADKKDEVYESESSRAYTDIPLVIILNNGSASASEIVAAALRDNKRALLVGRKSFGKGSVQTVIPMKDGSALRLTTSHYYTPSGSIIHDRGITPDVVIGHNTEGAEKKAKEKKGKEALLHDNDIKEALMLLEDKEAYDSLLKAPDQ